MKKNKTFQFFRNAGKLFLLGLAALASQNICAQYTVHVGQPEDSTETRRVVSYAAAYNIKNGLKTLYLNRDITTFISTGDNIKLMDLSLPGNVVAGNQPGENIVRIKPIHPGTDGADMGVITIVCECSLIQFNLRYRENPQEATSHYQCEDLDGVSYLNPAVDMTSSQMHTHAWNIINSDRKFYNVSTAANRLRMTLNNIYTEGNYFFIDVSLLNRTKIKFDIEEVRIKVCDKRKVKSTNHQELEIVPVMTLKDIKSFQREYRNVFVLPKLTFPDEKVLTITVAEKQISGRTITLTIDYTDVLCADSFAGN